MFLRSNIWLRYCFVTVDDVTGTQTFFFVSRSRQKTLDL